MRGHIGVSRGSRLRVRPSFRFTVVALASSVALSCESPVAPNTRLGLRVWPDVAPATLSVSNSTATLPILVYVENPTNHTHRASVWMDGRVDGYRHQCTGWDVPLFALRSPERSSERMDDAATGDTGFNPHRELLHRPGRGRGSARLPADAWVRRVRTPPRCGAIVHAPAAGACDRCTFSVNGCHR